MRSSRFLRRLPSVFLWVGALLLFQGPGPARSAPLNVPRVDSPFSGLGGRLFHKPADAPTQPAQPPPTPTTEPAPATEPAPPPPTTAPNETTPPEPRAQMPTTQSSQAPATPSPAAPPATEPALPRLTAHPALRPAGLAGVGLSADQVNHAIESGRDFLWAQLKADLAKTSRRFGSDQNDALEALALVHAGAHLKYPEFDGILRDYLTRLDLIHENIGTYQLGIVGMLIGDYADPIFYSKMRVLNRSLVEQQLAGGSWHYGRLVEATAFDDLNTGPALSVEGGVPLDDPTSAQAVMNRLLPFEKHEPGDNSTSQFAMLGLRAAARVRVRSAPEVWQRSLRAFHTSRVGTTGGWGYEIGDSGAYGSMTCAGLCSVAIARFELGEKDPAADPDIETGLAWLDAHFSVSANPERGTYLYYYLYSLERVGRILDTEFIGSHEWYPLGAKFLVGSQQKDGSWVEPPDQDPRQPTSFALLFLTRATQTLNVELKRGGQGQVTTTVATPPPARLYVILDASGSMLDDIGGRQKFDIARDAVSEMLAGMPETAEVAVRVYGHRKRSLEPAADEDTALEYPMAKIDRPKLKELLGRLRPRGKTPLALSLQQAKDDLASLSGQPVTVVLLTDGGEDTLPRRDPVKAAKALGAVGGVTFQIIGFDINQADWGQQLRAMSDAGGGHYWPAARAGMLARELRAAVFGIPADFTLYDDSKRLVGGGEFGTAKTVPEGKYLLKTEFAGQEFSTDLWVNTGAATGVVFDASRMKGKPAPAAASTPPVAGGGAPATTGPPAAAPATPHFCTHCGHPLPTGAKFCPSCGQPVPH